jgi:hypothetical protein
MLLGHFAETIPICTTVSRRGPSTAGAFLLLLLYLQYARFAVAARTKGDLQEEV